MTQGFLLIAKEWSNGLGCERMRANKLLDNCKWRERFIFVAATLLTTVPPSGRVMPLSRTKAFLEELEDFGES